MAILQNQTRLIGERKIFVCLSCQNLCFGRHLGLIQSLSLDYQNFTLRDQIGLFSRQKFIGWTQELFTTDSTQLGRYKTKTTFDHQVHHRH